MQQEHIHHEQEHTHDGDIDWNRVQSWIQTGILYLLGIYFIDLARPGGELSNYINVENLKWLTWVGALIFLVLGIINTIELLQKNHNHDHHDHDHHDHEHTQAGSLKSWIFLAIVALPLVLGLGLPSQPLGADAVGGDLSTDVSSLGIASASPTDFTIPPEQRNLLDWARIFAGTPDLTEYVGQKVDVIGFVYRDAQLLQMDRFMVVRFTLSCCVADARPIGLVVETPQNDQWEEDVWVHITGKIELREIDGIETPVIVPEAIERTNQPEQPYLYF